MEAPQTRNPPETLDGARRAFASWSNPKAPGLTAVVEASSSFAKPDVERAEVVIDVGAFILGTLSYGLASKSGAGNAATWLVDWASPHLPNLFAQLLDLTSDSEANLSILQQKGTVVASTSMRNRVLPRAREIARATVSREVVDLRHVLVACLEASSASSFIEAWRALGWRPTDDDIRAFKRQLLDHLRKGRERGEKITAWRQELGLADGEDGPDPPPPPEEPLANLSGFTADRPDGDGRADPLAVQKDVEAFARLIAFSGTDTPLSIGVFGRWGSGKSTFMERLEDEIAGIAKTAGPPGKAPRMLGRIVQVRFNAWHFADANLWASLTAEFFDQLRSGGYDKKGEAIHAQLVERVNAHVHDLSTAAGQTRQAVSVGEQKLAQAQKARDAAVGAALPNMSQKLLDALGKTYEANKDQISAISGQAGASDDLDLLIHAAQNAPKLGGKLKVIGKAAGKKPLRTALTIFVMLLGVWFFLAPDVLGLKDTAWDWLASAGVAGAVTFLGGLIALVRPGVQLLTMVISGTAGVTKELQAAEADQLKSVLAAEATLKAAADEAAARRQASDRASQALSRYIDPASQGNPPRLLRYMLDDDPDTRALEKEIGLMGRARRLFEAVDKIVEEERKSEKPNPDTPERIVLYIDDLDRCTYEEVYAVLQAVHLLLAFKLFVVVVAVDVNWVTEALAHQAGRPMDAGAAVSAGDDPRSRNRAIHYLEKIFQLPFWIRPMGGDGAVYGEFVRGLLKGKAEAVPPALVEMAVAADEDAPAPLADPGPKIESPVEATEDAAPTPQVESSPSPLPPPQDDLRTLVFSEPEAAFLASPELAAIAATTPRGVLRMINIYRIVRLTTPGSLGDGHSLWPLVAVFAAIETMGDATLADALYEELKATSPGYPIFPHFDKKTADPRIAEAFKRHAGLEAALKAAAAASGRDILYAGDCLAAVRAVRRYSFNRY